MGNKRHLEPAGRTGVSILEALIRRLPLIALVAIALSPVEPHIRWEYRYVDGYSPKIYTSCTYLGSRGRVVPHNPTPDCPFLVILDSRDWRKP